MKFSIELTLVSDFEKAKKFFIETLGLKVAGINEKFGWLELKGEKGGATLGVAKMDPHSPLPPGSNAVVTLVVEDITSAKNKLIAKGTQMSGDMSEIAEAGMKFQLFKDPDGNYFQLVDIKFSK